MYKTGNLKNKYIYIILYKACKDINAGKCKGRACQMNNVGY